MNKRTSRKKVVGLPLLPLMEIVRPSIALATITTSGIGDNYYAFLRKIKDNLLGCNSSMNSITTAVLCL